jgi:hypothetical protein
VKCRLKEKCAFKHTETKHIGKNNNTDQISALEEVVKELLDYKRESEAKIASLENQLINIKGMLGREGDMLEKDLKKKQNDIADIKRDVKGLKSEFALSKLCEKNQLPSKSDAKVVQQSDMPPGHKCDQCDMTFQTENGVRVHIDLAHINAKPEEIKKCKYCNYKSAISAMDVHIQNFHKFRCLKCTYSLHNQDRLDYHMRLAHGQNKVSNPV